jgi:hypothetical protein
LPGLPDYLPTLSVGLPGLPDDLLALPDDLLPAPATPRKKAGQLAGLSLNARI